MLQVDEFQQYLRALQPCSHQLSMVDTIASLMRHCAHSLTDLSLNSMRPQSSVVQLTKAKLQSVARGSSARGWDDFAMGERLAMRRRRTDHAAALSFAWPLCVAELD